MAERGIRENIGNPLETEKREFREFPEDGTYIPISISDVDRLKDDPAQVGRMVVEQLTEKRERENRLRSNIAFQVVHLADCEKWTGIRSVHANAEKDLQEIVFGGKTESGPFVVASTKPDDEEQFGHLIKNEEIMPGVWGGTGRIFITPDIVAKIKQQTLETRVFPSDNGVYHDESGYYIRELVPFEIPK